MMTEISNRNMSDINTDENSMIKSFRLSQLKTPIIRSAINNESRSMATMGMNKRLYLSSPTRISWAELRFLAIALGFTNDVFERSCVARSFARDLDDGLSDAELTSLLDSHGIQHALSEDNTQHDYLSNRRVIVQALKMLRSRSLAFGEIRAARIAFDFFEGTDRGIPATELVLMRIIQMCGKVIAPIKLMSSTYVEGRNRIHFFEFLIILGLCEDADSLQSEFVVRSGKDARDLYEICEFDQLFLTQEQRMHNVLNRRYRLVQNLEGSNDIAASAAATLAAAAEKNSNTDKTNATESGLDDNSGWITRLQRDIMDEQSMNIALRQDHASMKEDLGRSSRQLKSIKALYYGTYNDSLRPSTALLPLTDPKECNAKNRTKTLIRTRKHYESGTTTTSIGTHRRKYSRRQSNEGNPNLISKQSTSLPRRAATAMGLSRPTQTSGVLTTYKWTAPSIEAALASVGEVSGIKKGKDTSSAISSETNKVQFVHTKTDSKVQTEGSSKSLTVMPSRDMEKLQPTTPVKPVHAPHLRRRSISMQDTRVNSNSPSESLIVKTLSCRTISMNKQESMTPTIQEATENFKESNESFKGLSFEQRCQVNEETDLFLSNKDAVSSYLKAYEEQKKQRKAIIGTKKDSKVNLRHLIHEMDEMSDIVDKMKVTVTPRYHIKERNRQNLLSNNKRETLRVRIDVEELRSSLGSSSSTVPSATKRQRSGLDGRVLQRIRDRYFKQGKLSAAIGKT